MIEGERGEVGERGDYQHKMAEAGFVLKGGNDNLRNKGS